jgi:hypothetical protein
MRDTDRLAVEVHYFLISADELAERSRNLRTLLLRGARRLAQQNEDCDKKVRNPDLAEPSDANLVEK